MGFGQRRRAIWKGLAVSAAVSWAALATAQNKPAGGTTFQVPAGTFSGGGSQPAAVPDAKAITPNGSVVEDAIVRVNDQVITRSEYERAQQQLVQEAKQENWTPTQFKDKDRDLLRDMIDQQLLLSRAKELGITGDAETVRQLDEIRKRANLPDMESLEKAAAQQGVSYEDFKRNIRNQVVTQQVVREEVGRRLTMTPNQEKAYYDAHASDFEQPEQVHLSEILIPTPENATEAQVSTAQAKADALEAKLKGGASFAEVAKASSGGPTASAGGDLGDFKRGMLGDVLEKATFPLPAGGITAPIRTRQGFVILKVDSHQAAGVPPLADVEGQVQEALYMSELQPALRNYLSQAREDAYLEIKPGFVDSGSQGPSSRMAFTNYTPPPVKKKVIKHQRAEQEKAEKAQQELAAAREKLAEKQAKSGGGTGTVAATVNAAERPGKPRKIRREKVRFGQAPRNALPNGSALTATAVPSLGATVNDASKNAPGTAMAAATQSTTSVSTGVGNENADPVVQQAEPERKTRFAARQVETDDKRAEKQLARAEEKLSKRPEKPTETQSADEKVQGAPLGLADQADGKKPKKVKVKRSKDEPKERLQDKQQVKQSAPEIAPTVNPTLGASPSGAGKANPAPTSDRSVLPPADTSAPGTLPAGKPIPSVTGTQPNAPNTTVPPPV